MTLDMLVEKLKLSPPKRLAIAQAGDPAVLEAACKAYALGIAVPILCGDIELIDKTARLHKLDISPFEIVETDSDIQSAAVAVSLVREGKADILVKGLMQTSDFLRAVLDKENGLRLAGSSILSHVAVMYSQAVGRTLYLTDGAMVMYPTLKEKAQLIANAVKVATSFGVVMPKVAVVTAVELVNPDMPATLDAAALSIMNTRGQIGGCIVDGPLGFDIAVSKAAALHKGVNSPVAGCADILLMHNIEAANSTVKAMTVLGGCTMGGLIVGASAPIVATSRSDSPESKLYSIASACSC